MATWMQLYACLLDGQVSAVAAVEALAAKPSRLRRVVNSTRLRQQLWIRRQLAQCLGDEEALLNLDQAEAKLAALTAAFSTAPPASQPPAGFARLSRR